MLPPRVVFFAILVILLPVLMREAFRGRVSRPSGALLVLGGSTSLFLWNLAYIALAGLATAKTFAGAKTSFLIAAATLTWSGALLRVFSYRALGQFYAGRIVVQERHCVVATGPYRVLRHPLHLGLVVEISGLAILAGGWIAWILLGVSALVLVLRNVEEERQLEEHLGVAYQDFRRQTWDIIDVGRPLFGRWR